MTDPLLQKALGFFEARFRRPAQVAAFAPGRVEVLGNHTDYNEGCVLSAAVDRGAYFLAAPRVDGVCHVADAVQDGLESRFAAADPAPVAGPEAWSNYVRGVWAKLVPAGRAGGFDAVLAGSIPLGAGLSSSAALEISAAIAFRELFELDAGPLALARIGQAAEHEYAGVKCGLLDQITSLFGRAGHLVQTDFRTLAVTAVPLPESTCLLACNTRVKHRLVDSEYNERRARCEEAAAWFRERLAHPVQALRDVSMAEWEHHAAAMPAAAAKRSAHVIGENERVLKGAQALRENQLDRFGRFMFESHASSRLNFQNSCAELDFLVARAERLPGVLGARLSGGGFGGSAVLLVQADQVDLVARAIARAYESEFGRPCDTLALHPSDGARAAAMTA